MVSGVLFVPVSTTENAYNLLWPDFFGAKKFSKAKITRDVRRYDITQNIVRHSK